MVVEHKYLASNREDWLRWLGNASGDARDNQIDSDGQEGGQDGGEGVLSTTVLWHLDELLDCPTNEVIPAESSREREACNNGVERLSFELLGDKFNSVNSLFDHTGHGEFLYYTLGKFFTLVATLPFQPIFYIWVS